jgi:hypothetical protein
MSQSELELPLNWPIKTSGKFQAFLLLFPTVQVSFEA